MPDTPLINTIPDPETVRSCLSLCLREADLLRQMLKLAERVARERQRKENERGAGSATGSGNGQLAAGRCV